MDEVVVFDTAALELVILHRCLLLCIPGCLVVAVVEVDLAALFLWWLAVVCTADSHAHFVLSFCVFILVLITSNLFIF